jgi:hypothetical protein
VLRAGGARAAWLADLHPRWSFAARLRPVGPFTAEQWRAADPGRRRVMLESLDDRLSPGHEPLLVEALADPVPRVRAAARALLARLPGTAHGARLAAHARRHIRPGPDGRPRVRLPDLGDTALARDLDLSAPAGVPPGEVRREWLWTLVTHTPLDVWTDHLGGDRARVVRLAAESGDWDLVDALANAAVVQRDAAWARALVPTVLGRLTRGHDMRGSRGPALLALLPAAQRCAWALRRARAADSPRALLAAVEHLECPWTRELGAAAARIMRAADPGGAGSALHGVCERAEAWMPPQLHPLFAPFAGAADRDPRARLVRVLRFRSDMYEELL